jgi:hypothetical protein
MMSASEKVDVEHPGRARLILLGLCGVFVLYLLVLSLSEFASRRPGVALLLNPFNASALLLEAEASLNQDPPDLEGARRYAIRALQSDPLAPRTLRILARIAEEEKDDVAAARLMRLASRFARDGEAQIDLLGRSIAVGDFSEAVHRVDLLYRGQGHALWGRISQAFADAINEPAFAAAFSRKLGEDPPWRKVAVEQIFARAASVDALVSFYTQLPGPQEAETRWFMERLVREGRHGTAHAVFMSLLPPDRVSDAALLYNARFQYGVSNLPFDWVITSMPNTLTEIPRDRNRRLLRVTFFGGRTPYRNVNHLLALLPGDYVFSGTEQAISLNNPRGMRWRIACVDRPDQNLVTTDLLSGDIPPRPFSASFTVSEDCPFQVLQLELAFRVALEQEATGSVVYSDLALSLTSQATSLKRSLP